MYAVSSNNNSSLNRVTLDNVVTAELRSFLPFAKTGILQYLTSNLVSALGFVAAVQHLPINVKIATDIVVYDVKSERLSGEKRDSQSPYLSKKIFAKAVLRDIAVDRDRTTHVNGETIFNEFLSVVI